MSAASAPTAARAEPDLSSVAAALDAALAKGDAVAIATAHVAAADALEAAGDHNAACFQRVHAYVHALEAGADALANAVRQRLAEAGRET